MSASRSRPAKQPPSVDFSRYVVRRNPYAASIARTGIRIRKLHPPSGKPRASRAPSRASLAEMPELDMSRARKNRFARGIRAAGVTLRVGRGRPEAGQEVGRTQVRSVRLPARVWKAVERAAARQGVTVHALLRAAVAQCVER
jgi:hypothetical protein